MKYDFTTIMDRAGKDAIAIDGLGLLPGFTPTPPKGDFDVIPMWVADMNFPTVPTIIDAMIKRTNHPAFGYFQPTDEYFDSIIKWHNIRNGVEGLKMEHIGYENGVIGGLLSGLRVIASQGDNILVHSPTYVGFTMSLENNGFNIIHSPLVKDANGVYRMDFDDMERCIVENQIHATIFCSPHNPCGRVWEEWEIKKAMEVFKKHDVYIISDEIWSDLTHPGYQHIPTQSVSDYARNHTVALYAPSKTFNLAGLVGSYHIIYNKWLKERVFKESSLSHYNEPNVISMHALIGAYKDEGYQWLDELKTVISQNIDYACDYIENKFEGVKVTKPEATYMLFLDCTEWCEKNGKTIDEVEQAAWDVGVSVQSGSLFHGTCHFRMNLALPLSRVKEAFERLDKYVFNAPKEFNENAITLGVGQNLPNFEYTTVFKKGKKIYDSLENIKGKTVIYFLRYYGCTLCQLDIHNIKENINKFKEKNSQVFVVLQSDVNTISKDVKKEEVGFDIICDPEAKLYSDFNILAAKTKQQLVDRKSLIKGKDALELGLNHGKYEGEELQLPATIIVNNQGLIEFVKYGKSAGDVPPIEEILELL